MVRILKILICIEMFVIGLFVGYGFFVLHWLSDYNATPAQISTYGVGISNVTSEYGYLCYTLNTMQQNNIQSTMHCSKEKK